jgi:hypothetical protein
VKEYMVCRSLAFRYESQRSLKTFRPLSEEKFWRRTNLAAERLRSYCRKEMTEPRRG